MASEPLSGLPADIGPSEKQDLENALGISEADIDTIPNQTAAAMVGFVEQHMEGHLQISAGPLPSAQELEAYENVCAGAADRIIRMAEAQSEHRQAMESKMLDAVISGGRVDSNNEYRLGRLGSVFAFIICITIVSVGALCLLQGRDVGGFAILIGALAPLAGSFVYSRRKSRKDHGTTGSEKQESAGLEQADD